MTIQIIHSDYWLKVIRDRRTMLVKAAETKLFEACASNRRASWLDRALNGSWTYTLPVIRAREDLEAAKNFYRGLELALESNCVGAIDINDEDIIALIG